MQVFCLAISMIFFWLTIKSRHCGFTEINNLTSLTSSGKWQVSAFQVNLKPVIHSDS